MPENRKRNPLPWAKPTYRRRVLLREKIYVPYREWAYVTESKLKRYCLDPSHGRGKHKARMFRDRLGIELDDWEYLRERLLEGIREQRAYSLTIAWPYGLEWEVSIPVDGLNGERHRFAASGLWLGRRDRSTFGPTSPAPDRSIEPRPEELDVVRLNAELHGWPTGTTGTLVHAYEDGGVIEIDDDEGRTLDFLPVKYADLSVLETAADREHVAR